MLPEKDALTDETFNSLQQGTKVRFKWHGSDLLYEGRIEVDKRGDIYKTCRKTQKSLAFGM